jgi:hypothetical protein
MSPQVKAPTELELKNVLGSAAALWTDIVGAVKDTSETLDSQWKPSKSDFGRMCLLQHKKRTLLYLTPEREKIGVAVVLGERAYDLTMESPLPAAIKALFSEAKPYAEGRGIRFSVSSRSDIPTIKKLVEIKLTPQ